jgi:hypothetical protein
VQLSVPIRRSRLPHQHRSFWSSQRRRRRWDRRRFGLSVLFSAGVAAVMIILVSVTGTAVPLTVGGLLFFIGPRGPTGPVAEGPVALQVRSEPSSADVILDGRQRGRTPLELHTTPGMHVLLLRHDAALDAVRRVTLGSDGRGIDVDLWSRRPRVLRLRAAYPGARLTDGSFLSDGRVQLVMSMPNAKSSVTSASGSEVWLLDPIHIADGAVAGPVSQRESIVAMAGDGQRVAFVQASARLGPVQNGAEWIDGGDEVHVSATAGSAPDTTVFRVVSANPASSSTFGRERISGILWLPDNRHLLVAGRLGDLAAGAVVRTRLVLVDTGQVGPERQELAAVTDLAIVPADVLLETASWSPDGRSVAVLARSSASPGGKRTLTLDVLDLARKAGGFHYLTDLSTEDAASQTPPVAPVAWEPCKSDPCSANERLAYTASVPNTSQGSSSGGPFALLSLVRPAAAVMGGLFVVRPSIPGPLIGDAPRLGGATGLLGLAWRSPGTGTDGAPMIGLARSGRGMLSLRAIDPESGHVEDLGVELPAEVAPGATVIGVRWDLAHSRALLLARPADRHQSVGPQGLDAWLLDFGSNGGRPQ